MLLLQPQVLMVVVITSTGGVSKRIFTFDAARSTPASPRWAAEYLNERLVGHGPRRAHARTPRLHDPSLSATERAFLEQLAPAFTELAATAEDTLYVDGAARLLAEHRVQDLSQINELMEMLERRVALLGVLRAALDRARRLRPHRRARTRRRRCARSRSSRPATGCPRASSAPSR